MWLDRLRDVSDVALAARPLPQALTLVAETARELLSFDFCGVLVPDERRHALVLAGWSGLSDDYVDGVNRRSPVGLGSTAPSSKAFSGGLPVAVSDIDAESGFEPWGGVAQEQGYRSMISVPLRGPDRVLGTLNGYRSGVHRYSAEEVERLTLLANHAAAALTSAGRVEDLRRANASLQQQHDALARSQAIHENLLQVSLTSRGLDGVVAALSASIRRPVRLVDARADVLAETADWDPGAAHLLQTPVQLDAETVGTLVVAVDPGREPDETDALTIGHASVVLALELLRRRTALEAEHRVRGDLLGDVLLFGVTDRNTQRAAALGHDLTRLRQGVVASLQADPVADRKLLGAVSALTRLVLPTDRGPAHPLVALHRGLVVALWPDDVADDVGARAHAVLAAQHPGRDVLVATSGGVRKTLAEAVRIARGAHDFARSGPAHRGLVTPASLGVIGVLLQVEPVTALQDFVDHQLGAVIAYDRRRGSDLVGTVRVHLDNGLDRTVTGRLLRVHPNTVNQRLRRVEALTGVDLADPRDLANVAAALAVLTMTPP